MESTQKWVAIVDDDPDLLELLSFRFQRNGFLVKQFCNGTHALQFLSDAKNAQSLSLLILDRLLPDMDGLTILKQCAASPVFKIPIIILSSLSSEKDMLAGLRGGAVDYVTKPFNLSIFMEKMLTLISRGSQDFPL